MTKKTKQDLVHEQNPTVRPDFKMVHQRQDTGDLNTTLKQMQHQVISPKEVELNAPSRDGGLPAR